MRKGHRRVDTDGAIPDGGPPCDVLQTRIQDGRDAGLSDARIVHLVYHMRPKWGRFPAAFRRVSVRIMGQVRFARSEKRAIKRRESPHSVR